MSTGAEAGHLHRDPDGAPIVTRANHYQYFFSDKHHGHGGKGDARWSEALSEVEEFGIFDLADERDLSDESGNLYGMWVHWSPGGPPHRILELGTREERVAKFWRPHANQPWHGFPLWPISGPHTPNRAQQKHRPPKSVFVKMVVAGLITPEQQRRLQKGDDHL